MQEYNYIPLVRLEMVKEKMIPYAKERLATSDDVVSLARTILKNLDREYVLAISVDAGCRPVAIEIISIGGISSTVLEVNEVFKHALLTNARGMILVHNHPSGDTEPSKEDISITNRISKAGDILGIELLDHIILGDDGDYRKIELD